MAKKLSLILDNISDFLAHRKGLLPTVGILLVIFNAALQFFPAASWLAETNLLLHLGIIVAIIGMMIAWAL